MNKSLALIVIVISILGSGYAYELSEKGYAVRQYAKYSSPTPPNRAVFDNKGNLYLNHYKDGKIVKVDVKRNVTTLATGLETIYGIAWGGQTEFGDYLYGTRSKGSYEDKIWKIGTDGQVSGFADFKPPMHGPCAIAVDTVGKYGGDIYAGTASQDRIYKVDYSGKVSLFSSWPGWTDNGGVFGLGFDTTGRYGGKLFAGTSFRKPNSNISGLFRIEPDGEASRFCDKIVSCGTVGFDKRKLYFGGDMFTVGRCSYESKNSLWRVKPDGTCSEFMKGVRSFTFGMDGSLYVFYYNWSTKEVDISRVTGRAPIAKNPPVRGSYVIESNIAAANAKKYEGVWVYKIPGVKGAPAKEYILQGKTDEKGRIRFTFTDQQPYYGAVFEKCSVDQYRANVYFRISTSRSVMYSLVRNNDILHGTIHTSWSKQPQKIVLRKITLAQAIKAMENTSTKAKRYENACKWAREKNQKSEAKVEELECQLTKEKNARQAEQERHNEEIKKLKQKVLKIFSEDK